MADLAREPSMEDILASIKRIIAEDGAAASAGAAPRVRRGPAEMPAALPEDEVLELTEAVAPEPAPAPIPAPPPISPAVSEPAPIEPAPAMAAQPPRATAILSDQAASASRLSLAALSALVVGPDAAGGGTTLEELVRDLLRPMLKDWLDAKLPELVEGMVAREIARITGRAL